jgi:hypothetical protein
MIEIAVAADTFSRTLIIFAVSPNRKYPGGNIYEYLAMFNVINMAWSINKIWRRCEDQAAGECKSS